MIQLALLGAWIVTVLKCQERGKRSNVRRQKLCEDSITGFVKSHDDQLITHISSSAQICKSEKLTLN